eukprot:8371464-Ditylum_brightwellii.AAC.1
MMPLSSILYNAISSGAPLHGPWKLMYFSSVYRTVAKYPVLLTPDLSVAMVSQEATDMSGLGGNILFKEVL